MKLTQPVSTPAQGNGEQPRLDNNQLGTFYCPRRHNPQSLAGRNKRKWDRMGFQDTFKFVPATCLLPGWAAQVRSARRSLGESWVLEAHRPLQILSITRVL